MQPFFIELYNLNLPEAPTPTEKSKLTKLIKDSHKRYALFISAHQALPIIYSPQRNFAFDWRKDWWEKNYPSFFLEYTNLRRFIDDYLARNFSEESLIWLRQIVLELQMNFSFTEKDNKIRLQLIGKMTSESLFDLTYWEIIDLLRAGKNISRCQAPKTQKTPACQNIFIRSKVGKKQRFCSIRCANRVRRLKYFTKTGK